MGEGIVLPQIVAIVRGHERDAELPGEAAHDLVGQPLLGNSVVLHFEVEVAFPEDLQKLAGGGLGLALAMGHDVLVDLPLEAGGEADEPFAVPAQQRLVDARLVVEAFEIRRRGELQEVPVARLVLREKHEMVAAPLAGRAVVQVSLGHVGFHADDRLDARGPGGVVQLDGAEHVSMVGERHRRHPGFLDGVDHIGEAVGPVEQAELAVQMEVDEVGHPGRHVTRSGDETPSKSFGSFWSLTSFPAAPTAASGSRGPHSRAPRSRSGLPRPSGPTPPPARAGEGSPRTGPAPRPSPGGPC